MNTRIAVLLACCCLVSGDALAAMGNSGQASQTSAPPSTQQTTPSEGTSPTSAQASSQPTDKKVWTNDDVGDLRDHAPISTIGNANAKSKPVDRPANPPKGAKSAKWYVDQIQALQAKIPPLNEKIQQLQAALRGDQVNPVRTYGGVRPDDWRDQLQRLQKERADIEGKISVLEDQARHDGVAPNLLPQQDTN